MSRSRFIALSLILDALLVNVGFVLAYFIRFTGELPTFNFEPYLALAPFITVVYLVAGYINELYQPERTENAWAVTRAVLSAVTIGTVLFTAISFFGGPRFFSLSRLAIVLSWFIISGLLIVWRLLFMRFSTVTWPEQRVLLLGASPLAHELAAELDRRARWGYHVVGLMAVPGKDHADEAETTSSTRGPGSATHRVFAEGSDLPSLIAEHRVDRLIVVSPVAIRELVEELVLAEELDVTVDVVPELYEVFIGSVDSMIGDIPLMQITRTTTPAWSVTLKRGIDIAGSLLLLIVLSPVFLLAAGAILVTMGSPVFFRQERSGRDLKPFKVYKFRSMVRDAEESSGPVLAEEDDPRVTPVGRFLRRSRIDELPQLVNILKGDMSFVGPRPERPYFVEQHLAEIPGYRERFRVHPGVTGLAQVMGGYATTPARKLKYDLIYMYHQSLAMDVQIVLQTLRVVLTGRGAR